MGTIEGSVWYRERALLPPVAEVSVMLEDVARMDAPSERIGEVRWQPEGGPPYPFRLEYDPQRLHPRGRYALRARIEAHGQLLFTSTEHIPAFVDGPVEILVAKVARRPAPTGPPDASVTNTYWKVVQLDGGPVHVGPRQREPHLVLEVEGGRVRGHGGCNTFTGTYVLEGFTLRFGPLAATRRMCVDGMEQEQTLLAMLAQVSRYTVAGDHLVLLSPAGRPVVQCDAVWLT